MSYLIEDRQKLKTFFNYLKSSVCIKPYISLLTSSEGWIALQNAEYLESLDNKDLVSVASFPQNFFSQISQLQNNNDNNNPLQQSEASQFEDPNQFAFELEISSIFKILKSIQYTLKKILFTFEKHPSQNMLYFNMMLTTEEGSFQLEKELHYDSDLASKYFFYKQKIAEFDQENGLLFQIDASYFRQLREFKNLCTELKTTYNYINFSCPTQPQEQVINISRDIFKEYNFQIFENEINGSLIIPPCFFDPHVFLSNKQKGAKMNIYFQNTGIQNQILLFLKTQTESITFYHSFVSQCQKYEDPLEQPILQGVQEQCSNMGQISRNNDISMIVESQQQQLQQQKQQQNLDDSNLNFFQSTPQNQKIKPNKGNIDSDTNYFYVSSNQQSQEGQQERIYMNKFKKQKKRAEMPKKSSRKIIRVIKSPPTDDEQLQHDKQQQNQQGFQPYKRKEENNNYFKNTQFNNNQQQKPYEYVEQNSNLINSFHSMNSFYNPQNNNNSFDMQQSFSNNTFNPFQQQSSHKQNSLLNFLNDQKVKEIEHQQKILEYQHKLLEMQKAQNQRQQKFLKPKNKVNTQFLNRNKHQMISQRNSNPFIFK